MKCEIKFASFNTNALVILLCNKVLQIIDNEKKLNPKLKKSQEALTGSYIQKMPIANKQISILATISS